MKRKWGLVLVATVVSIVAICVVLCRLSSFSDPTIQTTTNADRDWHYKYLKSRLSSLQPKDGQVQITGRVFNSMDAQTHTVPVGYKFNFPDDHGSWVYTVSVIEDDGVVMEYESTFDHRSFGKNLITNDNGTFKLPWLATPLTSASATQSAPPG